MRTQNVVNPVLEQSVEYRLGENPAQRYLDSLRSSRSERTMSNALRTIVASLCDRPLDGVTHEQMLKMNWTGIREADVRLLRDRLQEDYSVSSVNRMLSAVRGVLREAFRTDQLSLEDYRRAVGVGNLKTKPRSNAGRELKLEEIQALVKVCRDDETPAGVRDCAIIALLYTCGLRRAELVNLRVTDVGVGKSEAEIRIGRGADYRIVTVRGGALEALRRWMEVRQSIGGEALFVPILKSGVLRSRKLVSQSIYDLLKKRARQARVERFSPHDLRRTFVHDMLAKGVDISTVASIVGHSSVNTTRRYNSDDVHGGRKRSASLAFPYDG